MMQYHPECIEKMRNLCFYCWNNNQEIRDTYPTKEDYWNWFIECDNFDYMKKQKDNIQLAQ